MFLALPSFLLKIENKQAKYDLFCFKSQKFQDNMLYICRT